MTEVLSTEYTPEALHQFASDVEALRHRVLYEMDDAGSDPFSEQHMLLAIDALDQAQRYFKLAAMWQSRGLAR